jgi:hypothetical protein
MEFYSWKKGRESGERGRVIRRESAKARIFVGLLEYASRETRTCEEEGEVILIWLLYVWNFRIKNVRGLSRKIGFPNAEDLLWSGLTVSFQSYEVKFAFHLNLSLC